MGKINQQKMIKAIEDEMKQFQKLSDPECEFRKSLSKIEDFIISSRIWTGNPKTLEEVGLELNLSREEVRRIEAKVLRRGRAYIHLD